LKKADSRNRIRAFIAIPIPENISLFLHNIQGEIRKTHVKASWVRTSSMHLTLRFIGEIAKGDVKGIIRAMKATAITCAPFTLSAGGVGVFPGVKKARVIWSGGRGQIDQLERLQRTLEKNLEQEGITPDSKRFSPHFTLGRFKNRVDSRVLADIIQNFQQYESDPCLIKSMVLFKSDLKSSGAVHTPLFEAEFGDTR
jgi:2'-5' RNA ligase